MALIEERLHIAPTPLNAEVITEFQINIHESLLDAKSDMENGVPYTVQSSEESIVIQDKAHIRALVQDVCVGEQIYYSGKYVEWDSFAKP